MDQKYDELKSKYQKLYEENYQLKTILDQVDNPIVLSDAEGIITFYNKAMAKLDNLDQKEVLGKHIGDIYPVENHTKVTETNEFIDFRYHYYSTISQKKIPTVAACYPIVLPENGKMLGAYSFLRDLTHIQELEEKIAWMEQKFREKNQASSFFDHILGVSDSIRHAIRDAEKFAATRAPVLIYGETGTGKELFAQGLHNASPNASEPFIAVNCGAIPENLIESTLFGSVKGAFTGSENQKGLFLTAGKGTLFLDEINSMSIPMQIKLLRVLQEKKVRPVGSTTEYPTKCRILSSCNIDPKVALREHIFREDLYYRLAILKVEVPPLRERENDALLLAHHFAKKSAATYQKKFKEFDAETTEFILHYPWPGNVRELEYTIESCIASLGEEETCVTMQHISADLQSEEHSKIKIPHPNKEQSLPDILTSQEHQIILQALEQNNQNVSKTAEALGICRQNLQKRMKRLNIRRNR